MNPFQPFPRLETERCILRPLESADAPALLEYFSSPELARFIGLDPFDTIIEAEAFIAQYRAAAGAGRALRWGIELRETGALIGSCGFHTWVRSDRRTEIGYELVPSMWRRGVMSEVLPAAIEWGFAEMEIHRIGALVSTDNVASMRLLEKLGFRREGVLRGNSWVAGQPEDLASYSLLRTDVAGLAGGEGRAREQGKGRVPLHGAAVLAHGKQAATAGGAISTGAVAIRLGVEDAARYVSIRRRMLEEAPWAFAASLEDDRALDLIHLAGVLAEVEHAIMAIDVLPPGGVWSAERPLAAVAGIVRQRSPKFRHRARLWGVYVDRLFRGRGFGRIVVAAAVDVARSWAGVDFADLTVSERSRGARELYASLGFKQWGREPQTLQLEGARYDEIYMSLRI
jgi:[ribosomal protein S5]-alanine N-acetyltransferase